jgi:hypothetical protein
LRISTISGKIPKKAKIFPPVDGKHAASPQLPSASVGKIFYLMANRTK